MQSFIPLILMGSLFYVLILRPQRRRLAEQRALLASVAVGDRVMTTSGLFAVVVDESGDVLQVSVAPGVILHVARGAVARKLADDAPDAPSVEDLVGSDDQTDDETDETDEAENGDVIDVADETDESPIGELSAGPDTDPEAGTATRRVAPDQHELTVDVTESSRPARRPGTEGVTA